MPGDNPWFVLLDGALPKPGAPVLPKQTMALDFVVHEGRVAVLAYDLIQAHEIGPTHVLELGADATERTVVALPDPNAVPNTMVLAAEGGVWIYEADYPHMRGSRPEENRSMAEPKLLYYDGKIVFAIETTLQGIVKQVLVTPA